MLIDIAYLIILLLAVYKGFTKGFVVGLFSFIAFIIGLAAALKLSALVAHHLESSAGMADKWLPVISFALVFIVVVLLVNLGARIIRKTLSIAMLGWLDRLGGILLFICIYTIIFSVVLFFAEKTFLIKPATVAASTVHNFIAPWGPEVINNLGKIIPVFKNLFTELQSFFETLGRQLSP